MAAIEYSASDAPTDYTGATPNAKTASSGVKFSASGAGNNSDLSFSNPNFGSAPANAGNMAETYREFDKSDTSPIIPEISLSKYTFRVRELILGVVSIVALVACLVLIAIVATGSKSDDTAGSTSAQVAAAVRTLCTEPPCLKSAAYAVSHMNTSVNPCDNFYQYACGNYAKNNPLNPDIAQRTVFWNLYYDNEDKLRSLLESAPTRNSQWSSERKLKDFFMSCIDDYGKMKSGGKPFIDKIVQPLGGWDVLNTFNAQTFNLQTNLQKTSVDFWTSALFTFRVNTDRYDSSNRVIEVDMSGMGMSWAYYVRDTTQQVRDDYKKFMRTVGTLLARDSGLNLDQSQVQNKVETFVNDAFDVEFQLANITANTVPTGDPHNHERRITLTDFTTQTNNVINFVTFFQYMFGSNNVNGNTRVILLEDDWLRRMLDMVANIPASDKARKLQNYMVWRLAQSYATELSWDYIHASRDFFVDQYGVALFLGTPKHCFNLVDQKFPDALGALFVRDHFVDTNKAKDLKTLGCVLQHESVAESSYRSFLQRYHAAIHNHSSFNRVSGALFSYDAFHLRWLALTVAGNIILRKLSNYIIWRLARRYAQELAWDYIHANRVFYSDLTGRERFWGTWRHCFWHVDWSMGEALGALFAKQHFSDKNKDKAEEIVKYLKQALLESIDVNKFMDDTTKATAKAKITASTDKMGYPDIYMNDADIDNVYQSLTVNRSDYFQSLLNLNGFEKTFWTRRLTTGEDRSVWLFNSYDTTMSFYNPWNQLLVPAGMLQFPVYEWTLPHYHNFGSMGGLVGHYLVHGIDNWGGYYDANGNYGSWYTNQTRANYQRVEQCIASVFNNQTMGPFIAAGQTTPQTIPVDGGRFAWEGLAETSGVRLAYKAYKKWIADYGEEKPTPTPHYTNDQSFFLSYAQMNCYSRTDALGLYYAQVQRLSEDVRTNTALSLLDEFTSAFNCPAGSPMNSKTKCDLY